MGDTAVKKRRVEFTEDGGIKIGKQRFEKGDVASLDPEVAAIVIGNGWGKDLDTGETGERKPGSVRLDVDPVKLTLGQ